MGYTYVTVHGSGLRPNHWHRPLPSEKIRSIKAQKKDKAERRRRIEVFLRILEEQEECVEFEPYAFVALIDKVDVVGQTY